MRKVLITLGALATAGALALPPDVASASDRRYEQRRAHAECVDRRQNAGRNGTVLGAIGGAVLGSSVAARGAKTEGAVVGGVAGGLLGHQIAKKDYRCGRR